MPVKIPTSFKYSFIKFLLADSIKGNFGFEIACTFKAIPALTKYSNSS